MIVWVLDCLGVLGCLLTLYNLHGVQCAVSESAMHAAATACEVELLSEGSCAWRAQCGCCLPRMWLLLQVETVLSAQHAAGSKQDAAALAALSEQHQAHQQQLEQLQQLLRNLQQQDAALSQQSQASTAALAQVQQQLQQARQELQLLQEQQQSSAQAAAAALQRLQVLPQLQQQLLELQAREDEQQQDMLQLQHQVQDVAANLARAADDAKAALLEAATATEKVSESCIVRF